MKAIFWLVFAATVAVYSLMAAWSLPRIAADAGGLLPFDLRPLGYSLEEAKAFLAALSEEGRAFYRDVQHLLDLAYPALLAATLALATLLLAPASWGSVRWLLAALALPGMVFDYCENRAVAGMLDAGVDGLTKEMVGAASRWTLLKSVFTAVSMGIVLLLPVARFVRSWRSEG
jgi:hypothetical protein